MFGCMYSPDSDAFDAMAKAAAQFSPAVELRPPHAVIANLKGLGRLMGGSREIADQILAILPDIAVNLGIAATANAAFLAARHFSGVTILKAGEEAARLGAIAIADLPMPPGMLETLEGWGVKDFAGFLALPPLGILERFGEEGLRLQGLASGAADGPLRLRREAATYCDSMRLEHELDTLEPLLFILNGFLTTLCGRMLHEGVAAGEALVRLDAREYRIAFPIPLRDSQVLLKILHLHLEANPPSEPVASVALELTPAGPRVAQNGLFEAAAPEPARLQITMARIAALVGKENIGSPVLLDTHRPDAYRMEPLRIVRGEPRVNAAPAHLSLRRYRPPLVAWVKMELGLPRRIRAGEITGRITDCAGPWRGSGDWWNPLAWQRDEWDVAIENHGLYRIYCISNSQWFLEGAYD